MRKANKDVTDSVQAQHSAEAEVQVLRARIAELEQRERQTQEELRYLEEQTSTLEVVFETITDGLAVYDRNGDLVRSNTAFKNLMGVEEQSDYHQMNMRQRGELLRLRDEADSALAPERWPLRRMLSEEVLAEEGAVDVRITTQTGRELQLSLSGGPIKKRNGEVSGAVAIYRNVTERRIIEQHNSEVLQALLAMAEVLVQGIDQSVTGDLQTTSSLTRVLQRLTRLSCSILGCQNISLTLVDAESNLLYPVTFFGSTETTHSVNAMQQWQTTLAGQHLQTYFSEPDYLRALEDGQSFLLKHEPLPPYLIIPMSVGGLTMGLMALDFGDPVYSITPDDMALAEAVSKLSMLVLERERLLQDRAEAHAKELALLDANQRMDEFLSIASHELRTPLTTINGNIQLAKRRVKGLLQVEEIPQSSHEKLELVQDLLNRAERQVQVQNRLVGDLLDASRVQANRLELHMGIYDLLAIVHEAVEDQQAAWPKRSISISDPGGVFRIPVYADADRLIQVITNFMTNALKYSASDKPVAVMVTIQDQKVLVAIQDEGPGLAPQEQMRIWERFYRAPGITVQSGSGVGLGLGLYICRTVIERHQGEVGIESEQGRGATFWFTLPIAQE
ncbi:sensor histidine kinase [Tengunoibacter tsumagoiensis]|uniref:sensor histidine kinase n=1 Tax=Tengunoibacter tsumagoiensis TaxID=2014871 RepID=UPI001386C773|nr:ATP-binding protein [Tengunoibacter tsumagoiensis]